MHVEALNKRFLLSKRAYINIQCSDEVRKASAVLILEMSMDNGIHFLSSFSGLLLIEGETA